MIFDVFATVLLVVDYFAGPPLHHPLPILDVATSNAPSGCGLESSWQFDSTNHANVTMGNRSFLVHIPPSYITTTPHALVLSFHGFGEEDLNQEKISGLSQQGLKINGKGIIAVYPNAKFGPGRSGKESIRAWQGAPYSPPGVDDIAFTQTVVQQLQSNLCVDDSRIYASGKSNGGGFTNLLACTQSTANIFAAFAPVSAALYSGANPNDCAPGRTVPIINFHGLADTTVPFYGQSADDKGDTAYATPSITQYREAWAIRNGCGPPSCSDSPALGIGAIISNPDGNTTLVQSICSASDNDAIVNGFSVRCLGHSWPSTLGLDGGITNFNATTAYILPFFESHTLT